MKTLYFNSRVEWEDYMRLTGDACNGTCVAGQAKDNSSNCLCWNCLDCSHCNDCNDCFRCNHCNDCTDCNRCTECNDCSGCSDCSDCNHCTACIDCSSCDLCLFVQQRSHGLTSRGVHMPRVKLVYDCTNACEYDFVGHF